MRKKIRAVIFICILVIVSLSGCGKPRKDEISESLDSLQETASGTDGNEETSYGGIPAHLSYSVDNINVEADVISSGIQTASVYEAEVVEVDDALIAEYAEKLFDESKYEVLKPYFMYSMQELEDERDLLSDQYQDYFENNNGVPSILSVDSHDVDRYIENYDESIVAELVEGQLIYEKAAVHTLGHVFNSPKENVTYSCARLRGLIDGEQWELFYEGIDGSEAQQSIDIRSCESMEEYSYNTVRVDDKLVEMYGENLSNLESCQEAAEGMINKLGYENMEIIETRQLMSSDFNKAWTDGYKFSFARSLGIQLDYNDSSIVMMGAMDEDLGYQYGVQQEYIHVYISNNSVYRVTIDNIIEIGDMLSEEGKNSLLSFEKIDSIAREAMKTYDNAEPMYIDSVCLKYLVLPFEDGKYALMPVWVYYWSYDHREGLMGIEYFIRINAVDGTEIHSSNPSFWTIHREGMID